MNAAVLRGRCLCSAVRFHGAPAGGWHAFAADAPRQTAAAFRGQADD